MPRLMFLWLSRSSFHTQLLRGSTYSHVGFASCIHGFSNRVNEVTANSKIAHFHLPLRIDQHVRGLYICKKEHIPQSLSRIGGCAKPKKAKELSSSRGHQRWPCKALRFVHARNPAGCSSASSGDRLMGLSYVLQASLHLQTPLPDLGRGLGGNPACSHCMPLHQGWPRTSEGSQGNSSAGLGASPEDVSNHLELWQVPSWSWSHASARENPWGKDEGVGKGEEERGLQGKGGEQ